ncbi:MAG: hypothetical protein JXR81_09540 [Candidatus Goldbacteria bacterium]|nr:hypothetical protein [Candidatus Goldiibacteriota bacterium]
MKKILLFCAGVIIIYAVYGCTGSSNPAAASYRPPVAAPTAVPGMADWQELDVPMDTKGVYGHALLKLGGSIAVIGGKTENSYLKNVPLTADFETWSTVNANTGFGEREDFAYCTDRDKTYVIGGYYGGDKEEKFFNDTWVSYGALTFTALETGKTAPVSRGLRAVVFKDKPRLSGGYDGKNYSNDVYYFDKEKGWIKEKTDRESFKPRASHGFIVFDNKLWVIGGKGEKEKFSDVWNSTNGADWEAVTTSAMFGERSDFACFVFGGRMWVMGGQLSDGKASGDVWWSVNGRAWIQAAKDAFPARHSAGVITEGGAVYLFGGIADKIKNDGWWSK